MYSLIRAPMAALAVSCLCAPASAQEAASASAVAAASPAAPGAASRTIPAGAVVEILVGETISSKTAVRGDKFSIRLAQPIVLNGEVLAPAGAAGVGEVVHAAKARGGGKQGELILAARHLDLDGVKVGLRGFRLGVSGKSTSGQALVAGMVLGYASPLAMVITGGEIQVLEGTPGIAVVAAHAALDSSSQASQSGASQ